MVSNSGVCHLSCVLRVVHLVKRLALEALITDASPNLSALIEQEEFDRVIFLYHAVHSAYTSFKHRTTVVIVVFSQIFFYCVSFLFVFCCGFYLGGGGGGANAVSGVNTRLGGREGNACELQSR